MEEFRYPMWFKSKISGSIIMFNGLTNGEVIKKGENGCGNDIGFCSSCYYPHTSIEQWIDVTDQYKDKATISPLEMCGTHFNVEEKPRKYKRKIPNLNIYVYDILKAFNVVNPATQHAIKKLLCAGDRGYKDKVQDLKEALASIERAIELEECNVEA